MESWSERLTRQMQAKQRVCAVCGKVSYTSEREAGRVIREYHARMRRKPYYLRGESPGAIPKRAYLDGRCGNWHVTSQPAPRRSRPGPFDVTTASPLCLPSPPTVDPRTRAAECLEALALGLRDAIRRQGPGLRLPTRRALERHYMIPWSLISRARALLVETGWLRPVPDAGSVCYLTSARRIAETSREDSASLFP